MATPRRSAREASHLAEYGLCSQLLQNQSDDDGSELQMIFFDPSRRTSTCRRQGQGRGGRFVFFSLHTNHNPNLRSKKLDIKLNEDFGSNLTERTEVGLEQRQGVPQKRLVGRGEKGALHLAPSSKFT